MPPTVYTDLSVWQLIEAAVQRGEAVRASNGALSVKTGVRTGRSPYDKFIVQTEEIADTVAWGTLHQPLEEKNFKVLWKKAQDYLKKVDSFVVHLQVGADSTHYLPVQVVSEYAWHSLFAYQLFIRPSAFHGKVEKRGWTIVSVPGLKTEGARDGVHNDAALIIHLTQRKILLCGLQYAGEIKKAMFSVLGYWLPAEDVLPMHCAANVGEKGDVALFFGLSGTGKTTLSADPRRYLIGDDEHGWSAQAVFNFEGGCYAKCIDLSADREPLIWQAIRQGAIMENVILDSSHLEPNYSDDCLTQNTRVAYPIDFIPQRIYQQRVERAPEVIIFLTCDLYGVLPPVARLTDEQAAYYFLSGYTALIGSTEVGRIENIKTTFSSCFGAPFLLRFAQVYVNLFQKRLSTSDAQVYLVNTGWTGGNYGQGSRFPLSTTRMIIYAILDGYLNRAEYEYLPGFGLSIPKNLPGLDSRILDPRKSWGDIAQYNIKVKELITLFLNNAQRFEINKSICNGGPRWEGLE